MSQCLHVLARDIINNYSKIMRSIWHDDSSHAVGILFVLVSAHDQLREKRNAPQPSEVSLQF